MVNIRSAKITDVQDLVEFGINYKNKKQILDNIPALEPDIAFWFAECIMSSNTYVFVAEKDSLICGFIVLTEMSYPWNNQIRYMTDLLFLAQYGGIKLLRTAKALTRKKGFSKLVLSTSSNKKRSDKFFNHVGRQIGGVYEIEV